MRTLVDRLLIKHAPWLETLRLCPDAITDDSGDFTVDDSSDCYREALAARLAAPSVEEPGIAGNHLKRMLAQLGLNASKGCGCEWKVSAMNRYGDEWCRRHRARLVSGMRAAMKALGWDDIVTAATLSVTTGLGLYIDLDDVAGSLFDEAVRRSEAARANNSACP